ncbi:MAG: hypothetical protein ABSH28_16345, partial [Acidobacteriota bacterium]
MGTRYLTLLLTPTLVFSEDGGTLFGAEEAFRSSGSTPFKRGKLATGTELPQACWGNVRPTGQTST